VAPGLVWVGSRLAAGPAYVPLFQNLELGSVGQITEGLTKAGVAYQLEGGGTTVLVPQADLARARVALAAEGLPANGRPGLELFDKPTWGMTDFTQRITYRRALEGELARTIGGLKGVEKAQVHLAIPESSPLRKLEKPAEAAVVLTLKPGAALGAEEVQGIAYIVSSSVEGLPGENVAVMDNTGRVLSMPSGQAGMYGLSSRQLDLQSSIEKQLQDKAEGMLATVMGPGKARVQVSAKLNFDQVDRTIEQYDPDRQVLSTEQRSETSGGEAAAATGAPGASQTIISNQYANSKQVERRVGAIGDVARLTVAVLVDDRAMSRQATATGQTGEASVAALEALVTNAIGLDSARGDRITVAAIPFDLQVAAIQGLDADSTAETPGGALVVVERFARPIVLLVGVLLAFVLAWRLLKPGAQPAAATQSLGAGGLAGALGPGGEMAALASQVAAAAALPAGDSPSLQLRQRVQAESSDKPETAAQVMRAWMAER
jgi:flagellar M-ring protein FliF